MEKNFETCKILHNPCTTVPSVLQQAYFLLLFLQSEHSIPETIVYPCVVVKTGHHGNVLNPTNDITVLVDNQELCSCPDIFTAVILMLAAYYVFDITYPNSLENTLKFMESKVLGTVKQKISAAVQRRINILFN